MTSPHLVSTLVAPLGATLSDTQLHSVARRITQTGGQINRIARIDQRAADIFFIGDHPQISDLPFDILTQPAATRRKQVLVADMESTIIEQEMLDELAARIGIGPQVADITRRAMNGELDFAAALAERVMLLKGQPESLLNQTAAFMTQMPGAQELVTAMQAADAQCWLVSGGFEIFVRIIAQQIGFDDYFANNLLLEDGVLTGEVALPILDKEAKKRLLEEACAEKGCGLDQALAVGDGANDVPMLLACGQGGGLAVAYHAKPSVRQVIHNQINHSDLSALIYAQGLIG